MSIYLCLVHPHDQEEVDLVSEAVFHIPALAHVLKCLTDLQVPLSFHRYQATVALVPWYADLEQLGHHTTQP